MHRPGKALAVLVAILSVLQSIAETETTITVRLFNRSGVSASTLMSAEGEARGLLGRAGVRVIWLNCQHGTPDCVQPASPANLILTVLMRGSAMSGQDTLGLALQDQEGSGAYCYIFENKLNEVSGRAHITPSRLLAYAMAHELAHLLKGSHSHSRSGIMSARWSQPELEEIARGRLEFTPDDRYQMQFRLSRLDQTMRTVGKLTSASR